MGTVRFAVCSSASFPTSSIRFNLGRSVWRLFAWLAAGALAWGGWLAPGLQGQTAHFTSAQISIVSGLNSPRGVAVDGSGNIYIADTLNNRVLKETLSGGAYTQSTIVSNLNQPFGVAVDGSGNVYIADTFNSRVLKETLSGATYTQSIIGSGLNEPRDVAVDGSGNVYIADSSNTRVLKETLSGGSYAQSTIGSGLDLPSGVAVDDSGNLYIADSLNNRVLKETLSGATYTQSSIVSALNSPRGVAVDGSGNVYIADSFDSSVLKETLSGGAYKQSTLGSDLSQPIGVAVDASGNVYIADTGNDRVLQETFSGGANFGAVQVGTTSVLITLTFTFDSAGTIKAPAVLTQGAAKLDFTDPGTGTCTTNGTSHNYATGDTCTVDAVFTPTRAGTRYGAVVLSGGVSGATITTGYILGTGLGQQMAFSPPAQSTIVSGLIAPFGVAVDGNGNVYIADTGVNRVLKETLSGGSYAQSVIGGGLSGPEGVAVDGSGNVYIADTNNSFVLKETLSGGSYTQSTIGSGLNLPVGVAVDGGGNVYIADFGNSRVLKETLSGGAYTQSTLGNGLNTPQGVAVDGSGNVYIADTLNNRMLKETLGGGSYAQSTIVSGLKFPVGVAVDGGGNIYITDFGNNSVLKETLSGGAYTESTLGNGLNTPEGVAVDGSGNVYIADSLNSRVLKEDVADAPSLTFKTPTPVGSGDAVDGPQTVSITNLGNQDLNFSLISYAANFPINGADTNLCDSSKPLASGSSCDVSTNFDPTGVGPISGSVTLTDNNLNVTNATQSIALSGTGVAVIALSPSTLPAGTVNAAYNQSFAATGGTAPITFAITSGSLPPGLSLGTSGVLSGVPAAGGSFTFSVTATDSNGFTGSQSYTLVIGKATPVLTWNPPAAIVYGTPLSATQLDPTSTVAGTFTYTPPSGTVLNVGANQTLSATFVPSDTTDYNTPAAVTTSITVTQATLDVTANNATRVYGTANPAFTGTVTGAANGNTFTESFTTTATPTSNVGTYAIVPTVTGTNLSDYTLDTTDGTLTVTQAGTTTTLSASASSLNSGQNVTLTALVQSATTGTPTGTVNFYDGASLLGTATLSGGSASFTTSALNAGATNSLTAAYQGSTDFAGSTSTSAVMIPVGPLDFTLTYQGGTLAEIDSGTTLTYTFQISPTDIIYPAEVTFSASGLPPGANTTFNPSSVAANGGPQTVTMQLQTAPVTAQKDNPFKRGGAPIVLGVLLLPLLALRRMRNSRLGRDLMLLLVVTAGGLGLASLSGCGSASKNQTAKTYQITVTATSGTVQHSFNVTLIIEPPPS